MKRLREILGWLLCVLLPGHLMAQESLTASPASGDTLTAALPGGVTMEFVWIEPGTFLMGSPESEPGRAADEGPQHEVTISQGFYLGKFEVTQGQWEAVMGTRPWLGDAQPSYVKDEPSHPAVTVDWSDWQEFIRRLNEAEGAEVYRLPTEAEWEYACRAGTTTRWSFGDDENQLGNYAWYNANAWDVGEQYAHAVGTKLPNPWGVHDMHGNVQEWVQDWYASDYYRNSPGVDPQGPATGLGHFVRGGGFGLNGQLAERLRSAFRSACTPCGGAVDVGARLVKQLANGEGATQVETPAGTVHEMVLVPEGEFIMGSNVGENDDRPEHTVYLDSYYIDKFEVTAAQYVAFLNATGMNADSEGHVLVQVGPGGGGVIQQSAKGFELVSPDGALYPAHFVSWYGAKTYCEWAGIRLPTEAEWEKAARGTDGRTYPWGEEIDHIKARYDGGPVVDVGDYPAGVSPYGAYDMAGNVYEWVADWFDGAYYFTSPPRNPRGPDLGAYRGLRGGASLPNQPDVRAFHRARNDPTLSLGGHGFRCARDAQATSQEAPGIITTIAGVGFAGYSGDGGPATQAALNNPSGVAVDGRGNIYITDQFNQRVRRIGPDGLITTIAGTGVIGSSGDGTAAMQANFSPGLSGIALDALGNIYLADSGNFRVRRLGLDGLITTVAGTGVMGFSGDGGAAIRANLANVQDVAVDAQGNVYLADTPNHRIRRVGPDGIIRTIAGTGMIGSSGDGGMAVQAKLNMPWGVAVDQQGNVYIADTGNNRVRRVRPDGIIETFAGTGSPIVSGDGGPATQVSMSPNDVAVDAHGFVYIASNNPANSRIFRVGPNGIITTITGAGPAGFSGDGGPATLGNLDSPSRIAIDAQGFLYIADTGNHRIRRVSPGESVQPAPSPGPVTPPGPSPVIANPVLSLSSSSLALGDVTVGQSKTVEFSVSNTGNAPLIVNTITVAGADASQFTATPASFTIAAGGTQTLTVTFAPASGGTKSASLSIVHNAAGSPAVVSLRGVGTVLTVPKIEIFPTTLNLGAVIVGQTKSATIEISNIGGGTLRVANIVFSSPDFSIEATSFSLGAGQKKTLIITFIPSRAANINETLDIPSDDPEARLTQVPLRAIVSVSGSSASLSLGVTAVSFGQVALGEIAEFSLPVRNVGTATLTLSNAVSDNTQVMVSPTTLTVAPQETRSLTVRFRPLPGRERSGRLTLFSNDALQSQMGVSWSALDIRSPYLEVVSLRPADGAFGVGTSTELQLTFSEPLFYRRGFTALDAQVIPEPLSGPILEDLEVRGDGRTVVIPVQLARNQIYRLVVYGATGRSGLELFDMVETTFSTGTSAPVVATLSGRVVLEEGQQLTGSVYLFNAEQRLAGQASVALDGSFELRGIPAGSYRLYVEGTLDDGQSAGGMYDVNGDGTPEVVRVAAGVDQTGLEMMLVARRGAGPAVSASPLQLDLDASAGNQRQTSVWSVAAGQEVVLEVYAIQAEQLTGCAVSVTYDSSKVSFAGAEEGDHLLKTNGGTALFLSHVNPQASTAEFGGAILGPNATTAVSGSGLLGRFRFIAVEGFAGQTALRVTKLILQSLAGKTMVEPNLTALVNSTGEATYPPGPMALDFNPASGDQGQRVGGSAAAGKTYTVQLHVVGAPPINGWSAQIDYDPVQVRYVSGSFASGSFIAGLVPLVDDQADWVGVGGTVLGGTSQASGDGLLGTLSFEVLAGFTGRTELVISRISFKHVDAGEEIQQVRSVAALTRETVSSALVGDFNGDKRVDFSDFFLFADAFGSAASTYDLNGSGRVDFSDFFLFADAFGSGARAKLLALARKYLGLPVGSALEQNYPNPFNAQTTIAYVLPEGGPVRLEVYDLLGQRMCVLVDENQEEGDHQAQWDGRDDRGQAVSSGVYFYRMESGSNIAVGKMLLLK
jgi:formylglycine-generating enzyme required for sulfatase activity/sugar lactone lactonase YvrE